MSEATAFWIAAGFMAALAFAALALPFRSGPRAATRRAEHDLVVYRAQLKELERDLGRGAIAPDDAAAARIEIERRMLRAAEAAEAPPPAAHGFPVPLLLVIALAVPGLAALVYLHLGSPGLPGVPVALRQEIEAEQRAERENFAKLTAQLAARLEQGPGDPRGWQMLGRAYRLLGDYGPSVAAFRRALELAGGPEQAAPELLADYGETLVFAADGAVPAEALPLFRAAAARAPDLVKARHYLAAARVQAGDLRGALALLRGIEADAPPDAPWLADLRRRIAQLAAQVEDAGSVAPERPTADAFSGTIAGRGPDPDAMAVAAQMSPVERDAFVRGMVQRLADRLAGDPEDADGWVRLGRAHAVLGDRAEARAAFDRAADIWRAELARLPAGDPGRAALEERLRRLPVP